VRNVSLLVAIGVNESGYREIPKVGAGSLPAKEAIGHGIRAKRSKAGAVSFDVLTTEAAHA
jgi:hypothetical protein